MMNHRFTLYILHISLNMFTSPFGLRENTYCNVQHISELSSSPCISHFLVTAFSLLCPLQTCKVLPAYSQLPHTHLSREGQHVLQLVQNDVQDSTPGLVKAISPGMHTVPNFPSRPTIPESSSFRYLLIITLLEFEAYLSIEHGRAWSTGSKALGEDKTCSSKMT